MQLFVPQLCHKASSENMAGGYVSATIAENVHVSTLKYFDDRIGDWTMMSTARSCELLKAQTYWRHKMQGFVKMGTVNNCAAYI